jgi:acetyl-CoA/propionyl-CoA carboxylase biotin carboxyl carrier protein
MKLTFEYNNEAISIDLAPSGKSYRARIGQQTFDVEVRRAREGKLELLIDGKRITAYVSAEHAKRWVSIDGRTIALTRSSGTRRGGHAGHPPAGTLTAPMPGQVRVVNVSEGEAVTPGQTLLVLEAMKMEIRIQAPMGGVVKKLLVKQGQTVEREQMLVEIADMLQP